MSEEKISENSNGRDVAAKILKKNLLNIIRKVQDGKTLTPAELGQIQGIADGDDSAKIWAKTQVELADSLSVERKTIQRWLKVKGCPQARSDGRYNVPEFREWAEKTGRRTATDESDDSEERARLEVRRLRTICERLDLELEIQKGSYTQNDEVARQVYRMVATARKVLGAMPSSLAPQVVGMTIPEAEKRIREQVDAVITQLHEKKWD